MKPATREWAIVHDKGTDHERIEHTFVFLWQAFAYLEDDYELEELEEKGVDVMRIRPDGTLTTEY